MKYFVSLLIVFLFSSLASLAQKPTPPDDDVVRISTDLIQVDVTVTDKEGKVVSGLTADDFELYENGEKQKISNFSFVDRKASGASASTTGQPNMAGEVVQHPGAVLRSPRTIAIVVDDLNLSFPSVYFTRKALKKFVDEQMQPDDLVAIVRTGGGVGALQQFTSDKRLLYAAIERLRWNPRGSGGFDPLSSVGQRPEEVTERFNTESDLVAAIGAEPREKERKSILTRENISDKKATDYNVSKNSDESEEGIFAQASLASIGYTIKGMSKLPGRKTMMLFSDGVSIGGFSNKSRNSSIYGYLQDLVSIAARSSVVVYTFDTKGMRSMSISASDNTYEIIDGHRGQKERARLEDFKNSQDGLVYFASQTGGQALLNSDDLNGGMERALERQAGYYLLAYQPDTETFDPTKRKFNKFEVKVNRPGLSVSYRSGFFASDREEGVEPRLSAERQLVDALVSPFARNEIALNINALYADDPVDGSYIRSFLHIDAKSLKFHETAEGWQEASFDIAAVTFGDNGVPVETKETKYTIKTKGATYATMLQRGFIYVLIMPIKTPGIYQYRVALRDAETGKIGSASQVIDVPDLRKGKLTLSNLAVEDVNMSTWQNITAGKIGTAPGQMQVASTLLYDTVLKQFPSGTVLRYGVEVYNGKAKSGEMPELEVQAKVLQNNAVVVAGNRNAVDPKGQRDPKRIKVSGAILLKNELQPGDYVLQLTVSDRSGKQTATQLFPFEIVK